MKRKIHFLFIAFLLVVAGCTKVDVIYPSDTPAPNPETESAVVITPLTAMPGGAKYYFYDAQGGTPLSFEAPEGRFSGKLPFGTYRVLAVNVVQGVETRGMETFETASVYLKELPPSTRADRTLVGQPEEEVYVLSIDGVVVEEGKTVAYVAPVLLTRTVTLNLNLEQVPGEVTAVSGSINGAYPGVSLSSQTPVTNKADVTAVYFDTASNPAVRATSRTVSFRCFGLLDPLLYTYTLELQLTLTLEGGGSLLTTVDLTGDLAGITSSAGRIDIDVLVVIEPDEPDKPINPGTGVEDWEEKEI